MTTHDGPLTKIATWSATHRWTAIGLWLAVVALTAGLSVLTPTRSATTLELGVGESGTAAQIAADAGHTDPIVENALVTSRSGPLDADEAAAAADELASGLGGLDEVASVDGPITSDDGSAVLVRATMSGDPDTVDARVPALQDVVADVQADHPSLRVEEVGPASIDAEFQEWIGQNLGQATTLSVPVTLLILLVVFGAIVMAGIPLLLALMSVASGLGLWALASQAMPDPGMVPDLLVLMGLAVGVDYSLFYLRRFREEKHAGLGDVDAIRVAARTAGHSVLVSGIAVVLSMAGLYVAGDATFSALATGGIVVVLVALVSSLTVLPALLTLFGRWVDKPRVPVLWRLGGTGGRRPRLVPALLRPVLAHPRASTAVSVTVLLALAAPLLGISLHSTQVADFPRTLSTMQGYDRLVAAYPTSAPTDVVVAQVPAGQEDELAAQVEALSHQVEQHSDLYSGVEDPWFSADGRTAVVPVAVVTSDTTSSAHESVAELRDTIVPATVATIEGATVGVGGDAASDVDFTSNLTHALPLVLLAVLALTFVVMLIAFRSVMMAALTVLLNVLSIGATFGILTAVFQGTWAEGILGFTSSGHVVSYIPMVLFVILSGLSLDYHVFVVSRIRENAKAGMSARDAILDGVSRTAGTVTSAALVMIGVFSIFAMLSFIELKQLGVGLAVGILLDATVIRVVVLPAMMMLARRRLWWSSRTAAARSDDRPAEAPELTSAGR